MVKKYIEGESKAERKIRKDREKAEKTKTVESFESEQHVDNWLEHANTELLEDIQQEEDSQESKYYVLCLKHGTKYSADYVNRLYNMVSRNCTLDYEFVCLTDNTKNIDSRIKTLPLPAGLQGWWCKPYMFSKELPLKGTVLYMDLDVVVSNNIDKLFTWSPGHWCTIRDFTRAMRPKWHKYNSSVIRFEAGSLDFVWTNFKKNKDDIQKKYHGDQDYLFDATYKKRAPMLYPDSWILSWKWEVRKDRRFKPGGIKGKRELATVENVVPRPECSICVFHGDPNPENCKDPWVIDNWK